MFENLSDRLERSFKILKGEGKITEINVAETLKDVRRALLDADVNYKVAKTFTDTVKKKAMGMNVLTAVKPSQLMVKIVHDELAELMGGDASELHLTGKPAIILMSGLQGSGKTTFSGKLANMLKTKQHKKPLLVACDVYRPAAIEQIKVVGEQVGVPVYSEPDNKDVVAIANNAITIRCTCRSCAKNAICTRCFSFSCSQSTSSFSNSASIYARYSVIRFFIFHSSRPYSYI